MEKWGHGMDTLKQIFSQNLAHLRMRHHMTQAELGEQLQYSDKAISKWERGDAIPDAYVLKRMSALFHVSVDYLLEEHDWDAEAVPPPANAAARARDHASITMLSLVGVWTAALLIFIVLLLVDIAEWRIFVCAVPVSFVVLLVFNTMWQVVKSNFFVISGLVWSVLATVYLLFLSQNWWQLFLLGIPAQLIIYLGFRIRWNQKK